MEPGRQFKQGDIVEVAASGRRRRARIELDRDAEHTDTHVRLKGTRLRVKDNVRLQGWTSAYVPHDQARKIEP